MAGDNGMQSAQLPRLLPEPPNVLRLCYEQSGTDFGSFRHTPVLCSTHICCPTPYVLRRSAMSGTNIGYAATRQGVSFSLWAVATPLCPMHMPYDLLSSGILRS
eukprot:524437-Rhodomonas_salina.2